MQMLKGFLDLCDTTPWNMNQYLSLIESAIKKQVALSLSLSFFLSVLSLITSPTQVGNKKVFILVSGGVDSSVAFALLARSLGHENCYGLMVDQGLLRHQEGKLVKEAMLVFLFSFFFFLFLSFSFSFSLSRVFFPPSLLFLLLTFHSKGNWIRQLSSRRCF